LGDLPIPEDATQLSATDRHLDYTTGTAVADLVSFYGDAMKKAGWGADGDPLVTADGATMAFRHHDQAVTISAVAAAKLTDVTVMYQ
jgi:hypothetical protein